MRKIVVFFFLFFISFSAISQELDSSNFWNSLSEREKGMYFLGVVSALRTNRDIQELMIGLPKEKTEVMMKKYNDYIGKKAYAPYDIKYFDYFYSKPENKNVHFDLALTSFLFLRE